MSQDAMIRPRPLTHEQLRERAAEFNRACQPFNDYKVRIYSMRLPRYVIYPGATLPVLIDDGLTDDDRALFALLDEMMATLARHYFPAAPTPQPVTNE